MIKWKPDSMSEMADGSFPVEGLTPFICGVAFVVEIFLHRQDNGARMLPANPRKEGMSSRRNPSKDPLKWQNRQIIENIKITLKDTPTERTF